MELVLRLIAFVVTVLAVSINLILNLVMPRRKPTYPPIRNKLLTKPVTELVVELRQKKITSVELVEAYITRVKEVNPSLNAVVDERYLEALKEAQHADLLISKASGDQLLALFSRYPLLGIPFTVKESCGVKGLSFVVGSMHRKNVKCSQNGEVVEHLRSAGCIPLLVSANPELCLSFETNTHTNGRCLNPYDLSRNSAGSSGGEGALNGSGASLFGLASDIGGSIRLPALFCGVFGHKPTGGLTSVKGHFPNSTTDPEFSQYLQLGPITRFARDLPLLLQVMAGSNAAKLNFSEAVDLQKVKIYYTYGFDGLNGFVHPSITFDIKLAIIQSIKCFELLGMTIQEVFPKGFQHSLEICVTGLMNIKGIPSIVTQSAKDKPTTKALANELLKSLMGNSLYTKEAIFMQLMQSINAFMPAESMQKWRAETELLKEELLKLLGTDGVLFMPTFHTPATCFHSSILNLVGIDYMLLFNILGFPATHVPMGLDHRQMPIGIQIVAAPYHDKLCLQIAAELEIAFGGWVPPLQHEFEPSA